MHSRSKLTTNAMGRDTSVMEVCNCMLLWSPSVASDLARNILRKDSAKKRKLNPPVYTIDKFNCPAEDLTLPVVLLGPPGFGKTEYAMAHFKNPLMVRDNEYFKHYDEDFHDGMIKKAYLYILSPAPSLMKCLILS